MIIDTHTHLLDGNWLSEYERCPTAEELVEAQERFGVKEMWMSSVGALAEDFVHYNRQLYEITKKYPQRFKNFATASSYYGDKAVDEMRKCINDYGFKGIKVHYWMQGGLVHSGTSKKIMELAITHDVPVLFHDGTPPTSDTLQIAYLADLYPEAKIILGHSGMLDSFRCAIEACNTHDNVYLCISASPISDVKEICEKARTDRLLFGSDYGAGPSDDIFWDRYDAIMYGCSDEQTRERILYKNALALMG